MKKPKNKNLKYLIITLVILLLTGVLSQGKTGFISGGLNLLPLGISSLTVSARSTPDSAETDETKILKKENAELRQSLVDYLELKEENEKLREYFKISRKNRDYKLLPAEVIARDPDDDFGAFTIGAGTSVGVKAGDAVITENGLIGQVTRAELATAYVTTVLSPSLSVGAVDKRSGDSGVVRGSAELSGKNQNALKLIDENNTIKKSDLITTLGTGGVYPENLIIGKVVSIERDPFDSSPYAVIELYDDIKSVESVAVITGFSGKGEINAKNKAQSR